MELSAIQLTGMLRVMLGPMIPRSPYIGAVSLAFLENPKIDFDFTIGGLDVMETGPSNDSSISKAVKKIISNILSNLMVGRPFSSCSHHLFYLPHVPFLQPFTTTVRCIRRIS